MPKQQSSTYTFAPEMLRHLRRRRMTAKELAAAVNVSEGAAWRWLWAYHEVGILECRPRPTPGVVKRGKPFHEYTVTRSWGGEAV